jgi:hypothetical protein
MTAKRQAILYHGVRVAQRVSLLAVGFSTVLYWVMLLNVAVTGTAARETVAHQWRHTMQFDSAVNAATDRLLWNVLLSGGIALLLTAGLARIPRVLEHEKRMLIDSVVIIAFCLFVSIFAVSMETAFVRALAGDYPNIAF